MTYNNNVPQSGQTLGNTRSPINTNFSLIASVEAVNHVAFNSSGAGKHKFLQMPEQGVAPSGAPTTAVNEGGLVALEYNANTELAWIPENSPPTTDQYFLSAMPIRAGGRFDGTGANGAKPMVGHSFNIQGNQVNKTGAASINVTFAVALPSTNYFVIVTQATGTVGPIALTVNGFTLTWSGTPAGTPGSNVGFIVMGG